MVGLATCVDLHSQAAADCAREHWSEIRALVNPKISMLRNVLPQSEIDKLKPLMGGGDQLPAQMPSNEWLANVAATVPAPLLNMFGRNIIVKCVESKQQ